MSEPSLQCVPRDFPLSVHFSPREIEELKGSLSVRFGSKLGSLIAQLENGISPSQNGMNEVSIRQAFVAGGGGEDFILLSADYSQLELRILAHLSEDEGLIRALSQKGKDVFKSIAAKWKGISEEEVIK
jgi:hypothetical protein